MSGPSDSQISLRQAFYEAFLDWKMPAIIASIPALLEIALILFLVGCDVFLWTLSGVVFGLCTSAIVILISLAFVTTLLPVFRFRCPYKSPAGWACLLTWQAAAHLYHRFSAGARSLVTKRRSRDSPNTKFGINLAGTKWDDWRERTFLVQRWISTSMTSPEPRVYDTLWDPLNDSRACQLIGRAQTLSRALTWIAHRSQDNRVLCAVEECTLTYPDKWAPFSCLVLDLHIAVDLLPVDLHCLVSAEETCAPVEGGALVTRLRDWTRSCIYLETLRVVDEGISKWEDRKVSINALPSIWIQIAGLIARDLFVVLDDQYTERVMEKYGRQADYYLQGASILGIFLLRAAADSERRTSKQLPVIAEKYAAVFDRLVHIAYTSRFSSLCLPLYRGMRDCEAHLHRRFLLTSEEAPKFTRLAVKFPHADPTEWCRDECELFIAVCSDALLEWTARDETLDYLRDTLIPPLFTRMQSCADRCLRVKEWSCCERWLSSLKDFFEPGEYRFPPHLFPHHLITALIRCCDEARLSDGFVDDYSLKKLSDLVEMSQKLCNASQQAMPASQ